MGAEWLLKGLTVQPAQTLDTGVTEEVTNHLFQVSRKCGDESDS